MLKLFPLMETIRGGGDLRTIGHEKHKCRFYCPDGAIEFELEAFDKAEIAPIGAERLPEYAEVVRRSFSTVAKDFGWTVENAPGHISFTAYDRLRSKITEGYYPYGLFADDKVFGFVSLTDIGDGAYELNQLAVLQEWRHFGYGKKLLDFCKVKVREFGGNKIILDIIEENIRLKDWYASNGFIHTGTKKFEHLPFTTGYMEWEVKKNG
jgi:ribosomal protein S18 acetylase RimI-like enzyme